MSIVLGGGNNLFAGTAADDSVFGGNGNDTLLGIVGNDALDGGNDNDLLAGGNGNDTLSGGAGHDTLRGGNGSDSLLGGSGNDRIIGEAGIDTVDGGNGNDSIEGGDGDDALSGGDGNDSLRGDAGNDTVLGDAGNDNASGGTGRDSMRGGAANDSLDGGADNDTIGGDDGRDSVSGGDGADLLDGGADNDTLNGGSGDDTVTAGTGRDSVAGGDGADLLDGGADNDTLAGGVGNDTAIGGTGRDSLTGADGTDSLDGGGDNDTLAGGERNDTLIGGAGNDSIDGGSGSGDVAVFAGRQSDYLVTTASGGRRIVTDLNPGDGNDGTDTLQGVERIEFRGAPPANNAPTDIMLSNATVTENAAAAVVGTLSTIDPDAGNTHSYSIRSGGDGAQFEIVGNALRVGAAGLDFESGATRAVTIRATDSGGLFYDETFVIAVTNLNEAPTASDASLSLAENAPNGTVVGSIITTHPDAGDGLAYAITGGNTSGAFTIDGGTGTITVANSAALDFETGPVFPLTVEITDQAGLTDSASVVINLSDVNEAPSASDASFSLAENAANGTMVGTVAATDPDAGDEPAYAITGGNTGGAFTIDSGTGAITVANSAALDFETGPVFTLQVTVTDLGSLTDAATVTVTLTDVVETVPPAAGNDDWIVSIGATATWNKAVLLGNDSDADGGTPDVVGAGNGVNGAAAFVDPNIQFTPAAVAAATFEYTLSDGQGGSDSGLVSVGVVSTGGGNDTVDVAASDTVGVFAYLDGQGGDDSITAGDGTDQLFGGDGNDTLAAGAGNDSVLAGNGNDVIIAGEGEGDDVYAGGNGIDVVRFASQTASVIVDLAGGTASGVGIGADLLSAIEDAVGGEGDDTITGDGNSNRLAGGGGNDSLSGGSGIDVFVHNGTAADGIDDIAGFSSDRLDFSATGSIMASALTLDATLTQLRDAATGTSFGFTFNAAAAFTPPMTLFDDGSKIITLANVPNGILGTDGGDLLAPSFANRAVDGGNGDDRILDRFGGNFLWGGAGNDTIDGTGATIGLFVFGGAGDDSYAGSLEPVRNAIFYDFASQSMVVNLAAGSATGADIGTDTLAGFQDVYGGNGADTITGNDDGNQVFGDYVFTQNLGAADILNGGNGIDELWGQGGNDTLTGGSDADFFSHHGSAIDGVDVVVDFSAADGDAFFLIFETAISASALSLNAAGTQLRDAATGISFGFDFVDPLDDQDLTALNSLFLDGGAVLTAGTDRSLTGTTGGDLLVGFAASNRTFSGGGGGDRIIDHGADGNTLLGGNGADTLIGGSGNDALGGGAGDDRFVFGGLTAATPADLGPDTVADFAGAGTALGAFTLSQDLLVFSRATFAALGGTGGTIDAPVALASADELEANAAGVATAPATRLIFNTANGLLLYDADGDGGGAAVPVVTLTGIGNLAAGDIGVFA